jgi:hypothetical protein
LENRELIVLKAAVEYCAKGQEKIRYSTLKNLSNESLSRLTQGEEVDLGGNFENIIKAFEKEHTDKCLLKRVKESNKKSFIIPSIDRIKDYLEQEGLLDSTKEDISSYLPFGKKIGDTPRGFYGLHRITNPSERVQVYRDWSQFAKEEQVYASKFWNLSILQENRGFRLQDSDIQEILQLGNKISSQNDSRPFRIILEYRGFPESMAGTFSMTGNDDLETFTEAGN